MIWSRLTEKGSTPEARDVERSELVSGTPMTVMGKVGAPEGVYKALVWKGPVPGDPTSADL